MILLPYCAAFSFESPASLVLLVRSLAKRKENLQFTIESGLERLFCPISLLESNRQFPGAPSACRKEVGNQSLPIGHVGDKTSEVNHPVSDAIAAESVSEWPLRQFHSIQCQSCLRSFFFGAVLHWKGLHQSQPGSVGRM